MDANGRLDFIMRGIFNSVTSSVRKVSEDTFQRADESGQIIATDGSRWQKLRGLWGISTNKLVSSSSPTSLADSPIIVEDFPTKDVNILQKGTGPGTTTALWVTDENNWWAVGIDSQSTNCNCTDYSCCVAYGCTGYGCTGYGCTAYGCTATGCTATGCTAYGCTSGYGLCTSGYGLCTGYGCTAYGCTKYTSGKCSGYGCTRFGCTGFGCTSFGCTTFGCTKYGCTATGCTAEGCTASGCTSSGCTSSGCTQSSTCTTCQTCYPKYIKVFKSVASAISTLVSWTPGSDLIKSFRVKTKGNLIQVQAYSDDYGQTVYGSENVYDATSENPQRTNRFGIMITPATMDQANYSSGIRIEIN